MKRCWNDLHEVKKSDEIEGGIRNRVATYIATLSIFQGFRKE